MSAIFTDVVASVRAALSHIELSELDLYAVNMPTDARQ
jgi:hypothetical protein